MDGAVSSGASVEAAAACWPRAPRGERGGLTTTCGAGAKAPPGGAGGTEMAAGGCGRLLMPERLGELKAACGGGSV